MLTPLLAIALMRPAEPLDTSARLYSSCVQAKKLFIDVDDRSVKVDRVAECLAYISGFTDGIAFSPKPVFCLEPDVSLRTAVAVYLAYMDKNPKLLDEKREVSLSLAFVDAYPCKAK